MTKEDSERKYYEHLVGIMLTTRGVRFSVAESEQRKDKFSIATVALLSVYLAGWSLATSIFPEVLSSIQARALSLISAVASVSLLVISLFDFAAGRSVYAEKMLQNALSIATIVREAERELAKQEPNFVRLRELASKYEATISGVGVNHSNIEYKIFKIQRQKKTKYYHVAVDWLSLIFLKTFSFASAMFFQISLLALIIVSTIGVILYL